MEKIKKEILIPYLEKLHSDAKCALDYTNDYELLISIILSAQTTDKNVNKVTKNLFKLYPDFSSLGNAKITDIEEIIKPLGLYKNKAKNIVSTAKELLDKGYEVVPNDFDLLISLSGVGRKTANVFLAEYYDSNTLGVDTHINRIAKRLNIASESDDVVDVENKLKKFVKNENLKRLHHLLITFGRVECNAKNPLCESCEIKKYCKYYSENNR